MHDGHRQRLKERFLKSGISDFPDHNVLELLLFYTIPRRDTNELAHTLINTFGSLSSVFDASYEDLLKVNGVGENTATLIKLMVPVYSRYLQNKTSNSSINSTEEAGKYFVARYIGIRNEVAMLLCLTNKGTVTNCDILSEGSFSMTEVINRNVVATALKNNASLAILAHNHPGGNAVPSSADVSVTQNMIKILNTVDVRLIDHIIVADDEYFSMADSPKFSLMFM